MKSNLISFEAIASWAHDFTDPPVSASHLIPDWYVQTKPYGEENEPRMLPDGTTSATIKRCLPFFDGMTSGYIMKTWSDVYIGIDDNKRPYYGFTSQLPAITPHSLRQKGSMPTEEGFEAEVWKWTSVWSIKTPKGYSCLILPPIGYNDLPFKILPAVVDTDSDMPPINFPFAIRKGFSGVIKKGTPMAQIIPFKREDWEMTTKVMPETHLRHIYEGFTTFLFNGYRKMVYKKKSFR